MDLGWFQVDEQGPRMFAGETADLVRTVLWTALRNESFRAVLLFRLTAAAYTRRYTWVSRLLGHRLRSKYRCSLAASADIGGGLRLPHPIGIVVGAGSVIGEMVTIQQNVTVGANFDKTDRTGRLYPTIGSWSWIATGAVVAGPVRLGVDVTVGANAVVIGDAPNHAVVAGVPARLVRIKAVSGHEAGRRPAQFRYHGYSRHGVRSLAPDLPDPAASAQAPGVRAAP